MLKVFIDDSGSGGDSPWFVLAGYVGTVEGWDSFDLKWRTVLDGPPKIDYFKSSEAESLRRDGQWAGISKDERNARIDALIRVIGNCATRSVYVRLQQRDYDDVIKKYVPPEWDNAYFFLFMALIFAATSTEKYLGGKQPIDFVFDSNRRLEKPSLQLYGDCMGFPQLADRIADIHYEDEKIFLPLQAADLLAWQIRRRFSTSEAPRPQFDRAIDCPPERPFSYTLTRSQLEHFGEIMDLNAKEKWAELGRPEHMRPWKRP